MNDLQQQIDELIEQGYTVEEVTTYRVVDRDNRPCSDAYEDEDKAWEEAIRNFESDELRRTKQKLARWNAAVAGRQS